MFYLDIHVLLYYCFMSLSQVTIKQLFTFFVCNHRQFAFHPWTLIFVSLGDNKQFEHYFGPENQGSKKSHKEGDTPPTAILPTKDTGLLSVDTRTLKAAYQLGCHPGMYVEDKLIQLCSSHFPAKNLQFMNRIVYPVYKLQPDIHVGKFIHIVWFRFADNPGFTCYERNSFLKCFLSLLLNRLQYWELLDNKKAQIASSLSSRIEKKMAVKLHFLVVRSAEW